MATSCCKPTQYFFSNMSSTTIAYDSVLQQKYGQFPKIVTMYRDEVTGEYYVSPFFNPVKITTTGNIIVDHGGPQTGFITIS